MASKTINNLGNAFATTYNAGALSSFISYGSSMVAGGFAGYACVNVLEAIKINELFLRFKSDAFVTNPIVLKVAGYVQGTYFAAHESLSWMYNLGILKIKKAVLLENIKT